MNYDDLAIECFAFFAQAIPLEQAQNFLRQAPPGSELKQTDKQKISQTIDMILESANLEEPRFDVFVESFRRLRSLFERFDPINFHPAFIRSFFDSDDQDMWSWIDDLFRRLQESKIAGKQYIPGEDDVRGMRFIIHDLHLIKDQDKLFSNPEEWSNILTMEAEEP